MYAQQSPADADAIQHLSEQILPPHMDWSSAQLWLCNRYLSVATEMHTLLEILQLESVLLHAASDVFFDEGVWLENYRNQFLRLYYLCMLQALMLKQALVDKLLQRG